MMFCVTTLLFAFTGFLLFCHRNTGYGLILFTIKIIINLAVTDWAPATNLHPMAAGLRHKCSIHKEQNCPSGTTLAPVILSAKKDSTIALE